MRMFIEQLVWLSIIGILVRITKISSNVEIIAETLWKCTTEKLSFFLRLYEKKHWKPLKFKNKIKQIKYFIAL